MRSKTGIPPRLASTRDVAGRYYNSPYPQWMKTLDSKYQRLHTKIMQSTVPNRQAGLARTRRAEACVSRLSSKTRKTPLPTGSALQSGSDIGLGRGTPQSPAIGVEREDGDKRDDVQVGRGGTDDKDDKLMLGNTGVSQTDFKQDHPEVQLKKEDFRSKRSGQGAEKLGQADRDISCEIDIKIENDDGEVNKHLEEDSKAAQSLGCLHTPRNVTTSVSRTSQKTSRSCPAVIQTPRDFPPTPSVPLSMERGRRPSKRKHLKLFSRMSSEAQHAVNETLLEMGAEGASLRPETSSVTQGTSNIAPSSYIDNRNYLTSERLSPTEVRESPLSSTRSCASSSTCMSELANLRDRRAPKGSDCLFPDITPRSSLLPKSTSIETLNKTEELRIPGVGRYNVLTYKRERTFQITFGDFDIRYRDIIACDRQGSETPPAEIREKAIAKCTEWLEKYTPR